MNPNKVAAKFIDGFLEDAKPLIDLLKIEGYYTEDMQLTDKGKKVLEKYWAEKYKVHQHDWVIVKSNVHFYDEHRNEFIIDFYRCECGAGGRVKTPKAEYDKGNKVLGITEDKEDMI